MGDPIKTLNKINVCETILSSTLNGLIAADSLNIPNQWIRVSDGVIGGDFKFNDYYSVFDLKPSVLDLREQSSLKINPVEIKSNYKINKDMIEIINQRTL